MSTPATAIVQPAAALVCPCGISDPSRIYMVDGRPLCGHCLDAIHNAEPRLLSDAAWQIMREMDQ